MKAVAETLGVSRSNLIERLKGRSKPRGSYHKAEDAELLPVIRRKLSDWHKSREAEKGKISPHEI